MILGTTEPVEQKKFFSSNFSVSFSFSKEGTISGHLNHFSNDLIFQKTFNGLYSIEEEHIKLVFFIEWNDPNLSSKTLTTFSGSIFTYDSQNECLILKWLKINDPLAKIGASIERDVELLLSCAAKDPFKETKKILKKIPSNIFE